MSDIFGTDVYEGLSHSAEISACKLYRWSLRRSWASGGNGKTLCFIGLNPSKADGLQDDPTVTRCIGFTKSWGYSVLEIRNLFAYRATEPRDLLPLSPEERVGGQLGDVYLAVAMEADLVICAWGANKVWDRDRWLLDMARSRGKTLHCLEVTKHGRPKHPLFCRADLQPVLFGS